MPKIAYVQHRFSKKTQALIAVADQVIASYQAQGFKLTLRQLYYQFVQRNILPNTEKNYKLLGNVVSDGRMAGLLDWSAIEDRTRSMEELSHWDSPSEIVAASARQFRYDKWQGQPNYVEVWVEKEALAGVVASACQPLDVAYFCCRGYASQTAIWEAAQRLLERCGPVSREVHVLYLGDHDPSGLDMTRDVEDRLTTFLEGQVDLNVDRIALNMNQVTALKLPPNPAKLTDARSNQYVAKYGNSSWELDALDPAYLTNLIKKSVLALCDASLWNARMTRQEEDRKRLLAAAAKFEKEDKKRGKGEAKD